MCACTASDVVGSVAEYTPMGGICNSDGTVLFTCVDNELALKTCICRDEVCKAGQTC